MSFTGMIKILTFKTKQDKSIKRIKFFHFRYLLKKENMTQDIPTVKKEKEGGVRNKK